MIWSALCAPQVSSPPCFSTILSMNLESCPVQWTSATHGSYRPVPNQFGMGNLYLVQWSLRLEIRIFKIRNISKVTVWSEQIGFLNWADAINLPMSLLTRLDATFLWHFHVFLFSCMSAKIQPGLYLCRYSSSKFMPIPAPKSANTVPFLSPDLPYLFLDHLMCFWCCIPDHLFFLKRLKYIFIQCNSLILLKSQALLILAQSCCTLRDSYLDPLFCYFKHKNGQDVRNRKQGGTVASEQVDMKI